MKVRYLWIASACLVHVLLLFCNTSAAAYSARYDVNEFKKTVLDLPLTIVGPSLSEYLMSFKKEAIMDGFFFYYKDTAAYPHLCTEQRLIEEITNVYTSLKKRLESAQRDAFHYNNVLQFGILADLVIRYMGYKPAGSVYVHWGGFQELGDNPSQYIRSFGYNNRDVNATVNVISNLWLNAWGNTQDSERAGHPFLYVPRTGTGEPATRSPATSGGTYVTTQAATMEACPKPYIDTFYPAGGVAGDQVKIRGKRFGEEKGKVTFSPGVNGEIITWINRRIHVIVPKGATGGPVTVSVACGAVSNQKYFVITK